MTELEKLRDRVEELEQLFGLHLNLPHPYKLTPLEEKFVGLLIRRKIMNAEMFRAAIYGGLSDRSESIVNVHIMKIRRKLAPYGLTIRNRYGEGFYLDDHTREVLRKKVRAE